MLKTNSIIMLLIACTSMLFAETLAINLLNVNHAGGPGKMEIDSGVFRLERCRHATERYLTLLKENPVNGTGAYLLKGRFHATTIGARAQVGLLARTAENGWIREWASPILEKDQEFAVRAWLPDSAAKLEILLMSHEGIVEFSQLELIKTDYLEDNGVFAPDMEFWINMDYIDNVAYRKNLHVEDYDEPVIAEYFRKCKAHGITGVLWRVSCMGQFGYRTKVGTIYPDLNGDSLSDGEIKMREYIKRFDPVEVAVREARKNDIQIYFWMTLSDEAYNHPTRGKIHHSQFQLDHPETILLDRQGNPLYGTMCYSEPAARKYRMDIIRELIEYKADGIYLCTRSHCFSFGTDKSGNDYGFNPTVVRQYKERYGVDILTQDFDVKKWQDLKAEGFEEFMLEACNTIHAAGQRVIFGTCFNGISSGKCGGGWGNMPIRVKKYLEEGWIDAVLVGQNKVEGFFASSEKAAFDQVARPAQKLYFWAQMVDYVGDRVFPPEYILDQAALFHFLGANGAMYHESVNLEEHDAPEKYWKPLSEFYRKY